MKAKVTQLLVSNKKYRKSDNQLMARMWYDQIFDKIHTMSAVDLLVELANGNLKNWESVTRMRRKIQQDNPDLRDKKVYDLRMEQELEYRMIYSPKDTL